VPPSYVKLVCEERIEQPHVTSRGE
jgi:hypothetical protein